MATASGAKAGLHMRRALALHEIAAPRLDPLVEALGRAVDRLGVSGTTPSQQTEAR